MATGYLDSDQFFNSDFDDLSALNSPDKEYIKQFAQIYRYCRRFWRDPAVCLEATHQYTDLLKRNNVPIRNWNPAGVCQYAFNIWRAQAARKRREEDYGRKAIHRRGPNKLQSIELVDLLQRAAEYIKATFPHLYETLVLAYQTDFEHSLHEIWTRVQKLPKSDFYRQYKSLRCDPYLNDLNC